MFSDVFLQWVCRSRSAHGDGLTTFTPPLLTRKTKQTRYHTYLVFLFSTLLCHGAILFFHVFWNNLENTLHHAICVGGLRLFLIVVMVYWSVVFRFISTLSFERRCEHGRPCWWLLDKDDLCISLIDRTLFSMSHFCVFYCRWRTAHC